jgi:hypothetical protein
MVETDTPEARSIGLKGDNVNWWLATIQMNFPRPKMLITIDRIFFRKPTSLSLAGYRCADSLISLAPVICKKPALEAGLPM